MYRLFNTSKSAMMANQSKLDIISNNIANVNTVGYKKLDVQFSDLVSQELNIRSYPTNSEDAQKGTGVNLSSPVRNNAQGSIKQTGLNTDLAVEGSGFFKLINKDGNEVYSRNGQFSIDASGKIVDQNGNILEIDFIEGFKYEELNITYDKLKISESGEVSVGDNLVGTINLYEPIGNNSFISNSDNTFSLTEEGNVIKSENISIIQGAYEMSNVILQDEIVELIKTQRAFQFNSKGVKLADEMWSIANNLKSR